MSLVLDCALCGPVLMKTYDCLILDTESKWIEIDIYHRLSYALLYMAVHLTLLHSTLLYTTHFLIPAKRGDVAVGPHPPTSVLLEAFLTARYWYVPDVPDVPPPPARFHVKKGPRPLTN